MRIDWQRSPFYSFLMPIAFTFEMMMNPYMAVVSWAQISPSQLVVHPSGFEEVPNPEKINLRGFDRFSTHQNLRGRVLDPGSKSLIIQATNTEGVAPSGEGLVIVDIQVRFRDRNGHPTSGKTRPFIITREFALKPGEVYRQNLAQQGLKRLSNLDAIEQASLALEPTHTPKQVVLVINVVENRSLFANLDDTGNSPSALAGPSQPTTVLAGVDMHSDALGGTVGIQNLGGNNQTLALRPVIGKETVNWELSFTDPWIGGNSHRIGYGINLFNQREVQGVYAGGDREVQLSRGRNPWVHRLGGGVEVFQALNDAMTIAVGASYQQVSIRNRAFSSTLKPVDRLGNPLTVSPDGQDDLLLLKASGDFDWRDNPDHPTRGTRLQVGADQAVPVGSAQIGFTRLTANLTQFIPVPLFGFAPGARTLIFNVQGGSMFGDIPGYEAFDLNSDLVRGFGRDGLGTGRSFLAMTAEYRYPIASFNAFDQSIQLRGSLFLDYATDLGSADGVFGRPAIVRDKPGHGLGYGFGLIIDSSSLLLRLEFGWSDQGSNNVSISIGDRF